MWRRTHARIVDNLGCGNSSWNWINQESASVMQNFVGVYGCGFITALPFYRVILRLCCQFGRRFPPNRQRKTDPPAINRDTITACTFCACFHRIGAYLDEDSATSQFSTVSALPITPCLTTISVIFSYAVTCVVLAEGCWTLPSTDFPIMRDSRRWSYRMCRQNR